jgi:hypothetical protein
MTPLTFDEMIIRSEFLQHVGTVHAAPVSLVEKVRELRFFRALKEA